MKLKGMSGCEIAKAEGVNPSAIYASLALCEARVKENLIMDPTRPDHPRHQYFQYSLITDDTLRRDRMLMDGLVHEGAFSGISEPDLMTSEKYYYDIESPGQRRAKMQKEGISNRNIATLEGVTIQGVHLSIKNEKNLEKNLNLTVI